MPAAWRPSESGCALLVFRTLSNAARSQLRSGYCPHSGGGVWAFRSHRSALVLRSERLPYSMEPLFSALGVPLAKSSSGILLTPTCLRGSGATDFYLATEVVPRVFWRGRWRQASAAERYLQAAAASSVLAALPEPARAQVLFFASASDFLVASFLTHGPASWAVRLAAARRNLDTSQGL